MDGVLNTDIGIDVSFVHRTDVARITAGKGVEVYKILLSSWHIDGGKKIGDGSFGIRFGAVFFRKKFDLGFVFGLRFEIGIGKRFIGCCQPRKVIHNHDDQDDPKKHQYMFDLNHVDSYDARRS